MSINSEGEQGIKLKDFIEMWQEDGTKLVEQQRKSLNGYGGYSMLSTFLSPPLTMVGTGHYY